MSSDGISGPSLDVNRIVAQLVSVERQPITQLAAKEASFQARISAYGSVKGAVSGFQTALQGLNSASRFQALTATPSDTTIFSASPTSIAVAGSYSLEVTSLAQAQKLVAVGQTSSTAPIGSGAATTVTFDFGTTSGASFTSNGNGIKTITIDSNNNSLQGIRDAINAAKIGVTATIINDGSGLPFRLALSSDSFGASNSIKTTVSGDASINTLLGHNPAGTKNLTETAAAQNALFTVNGVAVSKPSNSITDVVQGVTLTLNKITTSPATLTVARDTNAISTSIAAFVKAYNELSTTLKNVSAFDPDTQRGAILQGDATVRSLQTQLRGIVGTAVAGTPGNLTTLSSIGVEFQKDGSLAVNQTRLSNATSNNFDDIASLFATVGKNTDSLVSFSTATSSTKAGNYAVNVTQIATQGKTVGANAVALPLGIVSSTNDVLDVAVNGISASITLSPGTYSTAQALATELQTKINGVTALSNVGVAVAVAENAGIFTLTSLKYGSTSRVSIVGGSAATSLGLAGSTPSNGLDVAGSIGGVTGTGSGQLLSATSGDPQGLGILVNGGTPGARGVLNYSQGYASSLSKWATAVLNTEGPLAARTDGIGKSIKDIGKQRIELEARLINVEKRYRAQFSALDTLLSRLSSTSSFLTAQLASLPGSQK